MSGSQTGSPEIGSPPIGSPEVSGSQVETSESRSTDLSGADVTGGDLANTAAPDAARPAAAKPLLTEALVSAGKAAAVALVLAIPFIGVRLDFVDGANTLDTDPVAAAAVVVAVFLGRLAYELVHARLAARPPRLVRRAERRRAGRWLAAAIALAIGVAALLFPLTPFASRYTLDLAANFLTYVMLGWGLNVVVGLAGLLDLGYVAFYAAGAYTLGIVGTTTGFWVALPLSGLIAGTLGVLLGFPVLRLKGDYLAIVTLGFGEIIRIVLINWASFTGGPNGITGIPRPTFFGATFAPSAPDGGTTFAQMFGLSFSPLQRVVWLYYVVLFLALVTLVLTRRLRRLPIGRAWEAMREDETACRALGLDPTIIKLTAFAIGAAIAGVAGCFFATRQGFISPESFTFTESATILAIVVLGGMGSQRGVVLAAAVLVGLPEVGRAFAQYRLLVFGLAMVFIMVWKPQGIISGRTSTVRIGSKEGSAG